MFREVSGFNPLDRGNLNQMQYKVAKDRPIHEGFNPLDRGNLNQISVTSVQHNKRI